MVTINIGQILEDIVEVGVDVEVDATELAAGQDVQIPVTPQVGTDAGKPVYLVLSLTETKPATSTSAPLTASGNDEIVNPTAQAEPVPET
jgi:hypothetical protein